MTFFIVSIVCGFAIGLLFSYKLTMWMLNKQYNIGALNLKKDSNDIYMSLDLNVSAEEIYNNKKYIFATVRTFEIPN